jgi:signal-transduction protein with cAMP-binding, CBS, and nucleotidyltransferase domain
MFYVDGQGKSNCNHQRRIILLQLSFVNFRKDSFIIMEGKEESENFYIIQSGKVGTFRDIEVSKQDKKILGPGDFVGVISCMSGQSRTESAVALTDVVAISVRRNQYTETQTRKSNYERWNNVMDVFECTSLERFSCKHVLLVDDVLTTGATLVACADAFKEIEGLRISVLTLAWAAES